MDTHVTIYTPLHQFVICIKMRIIGRWTLLIPSGFWMLPRLGGGAESPVRFGIFLVPLSADTSNQQTVTLCIIITREYPPDRFPSTVSYTANSTAGLPAKSYAPQATHHKIHPPPALPSPTGCCVCQNSRVGPTVSRKP